MTRIERTALLLALVLAGCAAPAPSSQAGTEVTSTSSSTPAATRTSSPSESPPVSVRPGEPTYEVATYPVPAGSGPHDVAPAADGGVWYTAQDSGELGWLDPATGDVREVALGAGSAPHGVIVGPDGAPWVTDGGLNAIVRVDPTTAAVTSSRCRTTAPTPTSTPPPSTATACSGSPARRAGMAGSTRRPAGRGVSTRLAAAAPTASPPRPTATIYYASLAGSYVGQVDRSSGDVTVIDPPTAGPGLRRVWSDSQGRLWVSEWNAGQVGVYDPATDELARVAAAR